MRWGGLSDLSRNHASTCPKTVRYSRQFAARGIDLVARPYPSRRLSSVDVLPPTAGWCCCARPLRISFRRLDAVAAHDKEQIGGLMKEVLIRRVLVLKARSACLWVNVLFGVVFSGAAYAHGGGLNAEGCHTNRKTGEYHCHRGGGTPSARSPVAADSRSAQGNAFMPSRPALNRPTCYTGPRGGTYTITASGRKNYGGC